MTRLTTTRRGFLAGLMGVVMTVCLGAGLAQAAALPKLSGAHAYSLKSVLALDELNELRRRAAAAPGRPALVQGDARTPFAAMTRALEAVGEAGITEVRFAAEPVESR